MQRAADKHLLLCLATLVRSELLKASSYAYAARTLCECNKIDSEGMIDPSTPAHALAAARMERHNKQVDSNVDESAQQSHTQQCADAAFQSFMDNIGGTSEMVARAIVDKLDLTEKLRPHMLRFQVDQPWQALYKLRKEVYFQRFATPEKIREAAYAHNLNTLAAASAAGIKLAVATSSKTADAKRVLDSLGITDKFNAINGADSVQHPKPDPEIYLKTAKQLGVEPQQCMVFEDSLNGLTAAVKAGMNVVAVANAFTKSQLQTQTILDQKWIVYDIVTLPAAIHKRAAAMIA